MSCEPRVGQEGIERGIIESLALRQASQNIAEVEIRIDAPFLAGGDQRAVQND